MSVATVAPAGRGQVGVSGGPPGVRAGRVPPAGADRASAAWAKGPHPDSAEGSTPAPRRPTGAGADHLKRPRGRSARRSRVPAAVESGRPITDQSSLPLLETMRRRGLKKAAAPPATTRASTAHSNWDEAAGPGGGCGAATMGAAAGGASVWFTAYMTLAQRRNTHTSNSSRGPLRLNMLRLTSNLREWLAPVRVRRFLAGSTASIGDSPDLSRGKILKLWGFFSTVRTKANVARQRWPIWR